MHIFNLRTFPTVEMVRLALCSVVFLCSMLECVISTFIVLYLKTMFYLKKKKSRAQQYNGCLKAPTAGASAIIVLGF